MKSRSIPAAAIACCMLAAVVPAQAGYWNYGCKGNLGDSENGNLGDSVVAFDRNTFLIMPADLAKGDVAGLAQGGIYAFDADAKHNDNLSFEPVMKFTRTGYPDQKIVLTQKSRKVIFEKKGHLGSRETYTARFRHTYHYQRFGWQYDLPEADIAMDCFEKQITAP